MLHSQQLRTSQQIAGLQVHSKVAGSLVVQLECSTNKVTLVTGNPFIIQ